MMKAASQMAARRMRSANATGGAMIARSASKRMAISGAYHTF